MKSKSTVFDLTIKKMLFLFEIDFSIYPGFSGDRESPPEPHEFDVLDLQTIAISGEDYDFERSDRPDWFEMADDLVTNYIYENGPADHWFDDQTF